MSHDDAPGYRIACCCDDCMHSIERRDGWFCTLYSFLTQRHNVCDMYETAFECSCCGRITKEGTVKRDDGQIVCEMCDYDLSLEE